MKPSLLKTSTKVDSTENRNVNGNRLNYNLLKRHLLSYANEDNVFLVFKIQEKIITFRMSKKHLLKGKSHCILR